MNALALLPERDARFYLLERHREPLPANIAAAWLDAYSAPGDLVIDPFAASDAVVRAAVERGRRILAADSNPIIAWAVRVQATLPPSREIQGALARLGESRKEGELLRVYLERLYASQCANCGANVTVDYFVNRREGRAAIPVFKVYTCANCGTRRDETNEIDRQRAADAAPRGLHYHVLIQRLLADDAANTPRLKRLLTLYTPRSLSALSAIWQKWDVDFREDAARLVVAALLLHALDVGSALYPTLDGLPARDIPDEFVEVNLWRAMQAAAQGLGTRGPALRLAQNPAQVMADSKPAAYIGQGGARALAEQTRGVDGANAKGVLLLSSPARLDPTFWDLSFLWTRWLLGKHAAAALEPLFGEERQRWGWYGKALANAFGDAATLTTPEARLAVSFPSGSHAMVEALLLAASPNFQLTGLAFSPERATAPVTEFGAVRGLYQAQWRRADNKPVAPGAKELGARVESGALSAARDILAARGEPLVYSWLHHAALERAAEDGTLALLMSAAYRGGDNPFQFLRHKMEAGFKHGYIEDFDHWRDKERVLWLRRAPGEAPNAPLIERVEAVVRDALVRAGTIGAEELQALVLGAFPGLLTPEEGLTELCARAYADASEGKWVWRTGDAAREAESARERLGELGARLGYEVKTDDARFDLVWRVEKVIPGSSSGSVAAERFFEDAFGILIRSRVDLRELVARPALPLRGIVTPSESQVELLRERLRRDPRWLKRLERSGWEFLRGPSVELLLKHASIERAELELALGLEPRLAQSDEQMELF